VPALSVPRVAVRYRVALAVLAVTALTFLIPSAPTYDPWAWIEWGREILHLDLSTVDGPSWKPLPVLLTTPFALLGGLAPGLCLFWREPGSRKLAAAGFVSLPLLWLLPELWRSGDLLRAAHRAHTPRANSAAFSVDPIREVVRQFATMLTPALWIGLGALVV